MTITQQLATSNTNDTLYRPLAHSPLTTLESHELVGLGSTAVMSSCGDPRPLCAASPSVMASGVTGSVSVALHPLVILNISDHWIRIRSQEGRPMQGTV